MSGPPSWKVPRSQLGPPFLFSFLMRRVKDGGSGGKLKVALFAFD